MSALPTMFRRTAVRMAGHHHDSTFHRLIDQGRDDTLTNTTSRPYGPSTCQIRQYDHHLCFADLERTGADDCRQTCTSIDINTSDGHQRQHGPRSSMSW